MVCIYCGSKTQVVNSRHQKRINNVWRRRQCQNCGAIFTTNEAPDLLKGLVVISGAHIQPFSRDQLFLSLYDSLRHRKAAQSDATALSDTVLGQLYPRISSGKLARVDLVAVVLGVLKRFDTAAATHYQAFHPL